MSNSHYRKAVEYVLMPLVDRILGLRIMPELRKWRKIQWKSCEELRELQHNNMSKLLSFAVSQSRYYRQLGIDLSRDSFKAVKQFPMLTKQIINDHRDDIICGEKSNLIKNESSGSSGQRTTVYADKLSHSTTLAIQTLLWEWAGYTLGESILQLGIEPNRGFVKKIKDIILRTDYQPSYFLNETSTISVLNRYRNRNGAIFGGFASGLFSYAQFATDAGLEDVTFRTVISWGDKLFPHYRSVIEKCFHTKVFDTYGCAEGFVIAGQCEKMNYHIITPHVFVEIVDDDGKEVPTGEIGNVLLTRLDSFAMPLIRYKLGDLAIAGDPNLVCSCGRGFPLLGGVIGRETDIVRTRSGKQMIVHFFTGIFERISEIKQFRVVQTTLDEIDIEYVPANGFSSAALEHARNLIHGYLKEPFRINFKKVDSIDPTGSGKPKFIESRLPRSH